ncbi:hypothetical protein, partial [Borreliella garinii]|uniref:hypothetical protein n=1 Tax=Borreliella garinii TaxID=29519 RepID=UPI001AED19B3
DNGVKEAIKSAVEKFSGWVNRDVKSLLRRLQKRLVVVMTGLKPVTADTDTDTDTDTANKTSVLLYI